MLNPWTIRLQPPCFPEILSVVVLTHQTVQVYYWHFFYRLFKLQHSDQDTNGCNYFISSASSRGHNNIVVLFLGLLSILTSFKITSDGCHWFLFVTLCSSGAEVGEVEPVIGRSLFQLTRQIFKTLICSPLAIWALNPPCCSPGGLKQQFCKMRRNSF